MASQSSLNVRTAWGGKVNSLENQWCRVIQENIHLLLSSLVHQRKYCFVNVSPNETLQLERIIILHIKKGFHIVCTISCIFTADASYGTHIPWQSACCADPASCDTEAPVMAKLVGFRHPQGDQTWVSASYLYAGSGPVREDLCEVTQ